MANRFPVDAFTSPGRRCALCVGLKTKTGRNIDNGMGLWWMGTRCVFDSVIVVPPYDFMSDDQVLLLGGRRCPRLLLLASTGPFPSTVLPPGGFPPRSQISRAPIFGSLCGSVLRSLFRGASCPPPLLLSFGIPCSGTSTSCSPFRGSTSSSRPPSRGGVSSMHPALPFGVSSRQRLKSALASLRRRFLPTPCLAIRSGLQRLVLRGDGSFSLASELDAGSALS